MTNQSEKEKVYAELRSLRRRVFAQRNELTALRLSASVKEAAILRDEAANYRKALSNIAYRLDNGGLDDDTLRRIVHRALLLKGLRTKAARKRFHKEMREKSDTAAASRRPSSDVDELLHAMHDAAKFSDDAAKAILEGVLHAHSYAGRTSPYRGTKCTCDHCRDWRRWVPNDSTAAGAAGAAT